MLLGAHLSVDSTIDRTIQRAEKMGLEAVSIFSASPTSHKRQSHKHFSPLNTSLDVTVHAPYTINPASSEKKESAVKILTTEIKTAERLKANRLVIHAGSATDCTPDEAFGNLIETLNALPQGIHVAVENNARKGREICATLESLSELLRYAGKHVGVCIDTCHAYDAGIDITLTEEFIERLEFTIGLERLQILHINGSLKMFGSRKDRHANIRDDDNKIPAASLKGNAGSAGTY